MVLYIIWKETNHKINDNYINELITIYNLKPTQIGKLVPNEKMS